MRLLALSLALVLSSCAAVIGLEHASYDDVIPDADSPDVADEAGRTDAGDGCPGVPCGTRCCAKDATCIDSGVCGNDVVDVSGGGNGSCAVLGDGTVWCWGENIVGQAGVTDAGDDLCTFISGRTSYRDPCRFTATKVMALPSGMTHVGVGFQLACAVHGTEGSVWCWGRNAAGALGHDPASDPACPDVLLADSDGGVPTTPCTAVPSLVAGLTGVVELAVGDVTTCARTSGGDVFCWGEGRAGQLGNDAGATSFTPTKVLGLPGNVVSIGSALYAQGACAVSADGAGWCWGGLPPPEPQTLSAHRVTGGHAMPLERLVAIRAGNDSLCALTMDRTVMCWGSNDNSQLGRGDCDTDAGQVAGPVVGLPPVTALDGRWIHTCALDEAGKVHCWGVAQDGALGRGDVVGENKCSVLASSGRPTVVAGLPPIARIATGIESTFAVDVNGRLWAWGANDLARVGHAPKSRSDLVNCGDPGNASVCNPSPMLVEGLP